MAEHPHEEVRRLFDLVLDVPSDQRGSVLERECGDDAGLKDRILAMIEAAEDERFLGAPTFDVATDEIRGPTAATSSREQPGQAIGRYKLLQPIGEGGFGAVWVAEQKEPVKRRVALKIIKLGMDTKQVIARFEAERQALAMMDHPNIAKVLDAGATETGRPYFVMDLVKGVPITEYCDSEKLSIRERLDLFITVCGAVQHAHHKGIIHRDLKPSNVLVTIADGKPIPKVIDFGIAKATNRELTDKTLFTEFRQIIGTPEYMSPEQAEVSGIDIDTRSDVYSLGVLLYELITGSTPFDAKRLRAAGYAEMQRIIREDEPPKPSTRLSTLGEGIGSVANQRMSEARALPGLVRGDLDWIVMKAMDKDRSRRYDTANGLAFDVHRHLRNEPVLASPPSPTYRLRKFVRRNRVGVTACTLVMLAIIVGSAIAIGAVMREQMARTRAEAADERARLLHHLFVQGGQASIAVLPLENISDGHGYLADGVRNSLISDLSRISALQVVADRSVDSAFSSGSASAADLRSTAAALRVDGVVSGTVLREGANITLSVRLIHALTEQQVWDQEYVGDFSEIQELQHKVSRDIVAQLGLELTREERSRLANFTRIDPAAQEAYMKGVQCVKSMTSRDQVRRAIEYFDEAIAIEPRFAQAYAGKAKAYITLDNQFESPLKTMPHAKEAARKALDLDPGLAEAMESLGIAHLEFDWDWEKSRQMFERAIEGNPEYGPSYVGFAMYWAAMQQPDLAIEYLERALDVDYMSLLTAQDGFVVASYFARRYEQTVTYADMTTDLDPNLWYCYIWKGLALAELGRIEEAIEAVDRGCELIEAPMAFAGKGVVYAKAGRIGEATEALQELSALVEETYFCPYEIATLHVALGQFEDAFREMHRAVDERSACIPFMLTDPRMDPVRDDERYEEVLRRTPHREEDDRPRPH